MREEKVDRENGVVEIEIQVQEQGFGGKWGCDCISILSLCLKFITAKRIG